MKWTLSVVTALILFGCGNEHTLPPSSSVSQKAKEPAAVEPEQTGALKTIAPSRTLAKPEASVAPVDGAMLFAQKCAACHGQHAQKRALGQSQVIAEWESAKIAEALTGYKEGNYGGSMKALMQAQVKSLSIEQIVALAMRISVL